MMMNWLMMKKINSQLLPRLSFPRPNFQGDGGVRSGQNSNSVASGGVTLSRLTNPGIVNQAQPVSLLGKLQVAAVNQAQAELDHFLSSTCLYLNRQPLTGLDVLKLIDEATQKKLWKRNFLSGIPLTLLSIASGGLVLTEPKIWRSLTNSFRKGIFRPELEGLLAATETNKSYGFQRPFDTHHAETLLNHLRDNGLIRQRGDSYGPNERVILTPLALKILAKQAH